MDSHFTPHGDCRFSVSDNIITIYAAGPWNIEFFKNMHENLRAVIMKSVDINNYCILIEFIGESLASPESLDFHREFVKRGHAKAIALSLQQCTSSLITSEAFGKVYDEGGLTNQCFQNSADAGVWLGSILTAE